MLGLGLGLNRGVKPYYILADFTKEYVIRVQLDGGIVENSKCVNDSLRSFSNPIITLLGSKVLTSPINTTYVDAGATASDGLGDSITDRILLSGRVNIDLKGKYVLNYNVKDIYNKNAEEVIRSVYVTGILANRYTDRVVVDGGVTESLQCIDSIEGNLNWTYYFRVVDDLGVVESLECVII